MASLNLVPNTGLVLIQAGIFITNLIAVKKLMVEPYLKLRDKRVAQTSGGQEEAKKIVTQCQQTSESIESQVNQAYEEVKDFRVTTKGSASQKQHKLVTDAKEEAKTYLDDIHKKLEEDMHLQQQKVPQLVTGLVDETFAAVLR
ncbi:MAG: hypothetical protein HRU09_01145 [Oligoflexales bacterium]|nr:hypothetical protein [Oligoflexales bacterium]